MVFTSESTGEELYTAWKQSGLEQKQFWRLELMDVLTFDAYHGKVYRYGLEAENALLKAENTELKFQIAKRDEDDVFGHDLGKPWRLDGDWIICGDVHLNTTNKGFMQRPLQVAERLLTGTPYLFGKEPFTDWNYWLGEKKLARAA